MTTYYETDNKDEPLIPVKLVSVSGDRVHLEVTASRTGYPKGIRLTTDADRYVRLCGKQSGRFIGNVYGQGGLRGLYVRPVSIPAGITLTARLTT